MAARAAPAVGSVDAIAREQIMPGSREHGALVVVRDTVQRFRMMAFLCGVTGRGGRGQGQEQPALPGSAGLWCCPGDKMIDWASPACGDAAAQSDQAVRLAR